MDTDRPLLYRVDVNAQPTLDNLTQIGVIEQSVQPNLGKKGRNIGHILTSIQLRQLYKLFKQANQMIILAQSCGDLVW